MSRRMLADFDRDVGCCSCFGFLRKSDKEVDYFLDDQFSQECMQNGGFVANGFLQDYQKVLHFPGKNRAICRENPVKETSHLVQSEDANGHKMVNEYVRVRTIGRGSYGKVVLYQSTIDGKQYAIKAFYKSRLCKVRVSSSETALTDVRREASILKTLQHPNIVNLVEVIDDPDSDHFYIVLDYVDGKWVCDASGTQGGIGEDTSRRYLRDIISGLMYLHAHDVVHGDIKPENLLVTRTGIVKICDFGISHAFEDGNDVLRRSPGTPVFTAPECCFGSSYHGKAADVWAVGVTLYCMIFGYCPFIGDCLQDTYDKIVNSPLYLPQEMDSELSDLFEGLLCKDPSQRMTLSSASEHPWVTRELGRIPKFTCKCKSNSSIQKGSSLGAEAEIVYYSKHS